MPEATNRTARGDHVPAGGSSSQDYDEAVLAVVESIPSGRVLSYGDIAEILGSGGPRQVGRALSRQGGGVPWWRVTRADGSPPDAHAVAAHLEWAAEGTPRRGDRADMSLARWAGPSD